MKLRNDYFLFFKKFLMQPKLNASIVPSSRFVAQAMTDWIDFSLIKVIIEFWPWTWVFTQYLVQHSYPKTKIICIEYDKQYAQILSKRFGDSVYVECWDVHDLQNILARHDIKHPDLIISWLPSNIYQAHLLQLLQTYIHRWTIFRWFSYAPHTIRSAYQWFPLEHKRFVLRNVPPVFVFWAN